jgi:alpha-glucosidase
MKRAAMIYTGLFFLWLVPCTAQEKSAVITSPDKHLSVKVWLEKDGKVRYAASYNGTAVLQPSVLGLVRSDEDFSKKLSWLAVSANREVKDDYTLLTAKKHTISYRANERLIHLRSAQGGRMNIVFRLSDDGLAFRYEFPDGPAGTCIIKNETTSFHLPAGTKAWLQPMSPAKSGWEHTNPSYEEHYLQDIDAGTPSPLKAGWVYPALFRYRDTWLLVSETAVDSNYCGTRLINDSANTTYRVGFPDKREIFPGGDIYPVKTGAPWRTPWRIVAVGSLETIIESTLGTDLAAPPAVQVDPSVIRPGKASWSWIMSKDDSMVYSEQKRYIDFAAGMRWQYCLIDVNWDTKIGYDKIKELSAYAAEKNIGLLLWYNSAGDWNTTPYHPKSKLLTHEARQKEFQRLQEMGIKGVKIDFFGGDGQSVIKYYIDILHDAAKYNLLVNFHGATLPRGWQRTYPHLMTTEAVRGFEMVTFMQEDADREATHCTMLPFTRNAFDPMDFTPMNLHKIPTQVQRKTTAGFELALSVLFLSGIQHYAESPAGMQEMPGFVKGFLQELPAYWNDVRFIDGYPGKFVVIARQSGNDWYLAGINGEHTGRVQDIDLSFLRDKKIIMISDDENSGSLMQQAVHPGLLRIAMQPRGGFVIVAK